MANSVNYHHFKTLLNAYKKEYPEKNKNACQNAVAGPPPKGKTLKRKLQNE